MSMYLYSSSYEECIVYEHGFKSMNIDEYTTSIEYPWL